TDGVTDGEELHAVIYNSNPRSSDYSFIYDTPRPGHADFAALQKYGGDVDLRGGGHFSGRLTAPLCIAGGLARQYLAARGITVGAHVAAIADVKDARFGTEIGAEELAQLERMPFPLLDSKKESAMRKRILTARAEGDSVGGVVECAVVGLPAGLGEHMFSGVEGRVAALAFSVPAVKGVEFGAGFAAAEMRGSENNDAFRTDGKRVFTATNHCGGILGGMTNGMPLVFRVAFKPTPSISREQDTVSLFEMKNTKLSVKGRHDPCVVLRAVPVIEAVAALAVLDLYLDPDAKEV
ncbi:MAG: chorismate synthase, partial [Clostridia bacterium]|nr:chorismate synthase [Clostridia bacterium]